MGGIFILRIEDTDEVRSTPESVQAIFEGMKWLGLDWDEGPNPQGESRGSVGPYFQMQRLGIYQSAVDRLLNEGKAYRCYCTPQEVDKMRERAQLLKRPPKYDGTCRSLTESQRAARAAEGRTFSVRFKTPQEGHTRFDDIVRGAMEFENALMEDFVIQKTSGVPTYNFACVVDDHFMEISHVIRGDDHLSNTPRQIVACQALGWESPRFVHLSMILGTDGSRLSKRHGATSVREYEEAGYLPEAVRNYLALLGWATEESQQLFTQEDLRQKFTLERCGKSSAIFDPPKLLWMNGEYIRHMPLAELVDRAMPFIEKAGFLGGQEKERCSEIEAVLALEHEKVKRLSDVPTLIDFFFKDVEYDPASVEKALKKQGVADVLREGIDVFTRLNPFTARVTEKACQDLATRRGIKNAAVFHPIRVSVSGRMQGPSLFHMLEVMGRDKVIHRIKKTLETLFP
jgi:glutamyl-tRNA synthetase